MKLENQLTSLEISKKLKELGVEQKSLFSHYHTISNYQKIESSTHNRATFEKVFGSVDKTYSAFTVAELGEMLPRRVFSKDFGSGWLCGEMRTETFNEHPQDIVTYQDSTDSLTEANARGKCLIYLKEQKLI